MGDDRDRLIGNEQTKLLAGMFDRLGTAMAAVGVIAPLAGLAYDTGDFRAHLNGAWGVTASLWIIMVVFLHYLARQTLMDLK